MVILALVLAGAPAKALDYEITKVVEIGPADWVPMQGPLKWSPDGQWLAYFHDGWLMLSDTLGKSRKIWESEFGPHLMEWLSNEEIIVREWDPGYGQTRHKISIIDLKTGGEEILLEETQPWKGAKKGQFNEYEGPRRTVEGNVYYTIKKGDDIRAVLPRPKSDMPEKSLSIEDNHIVHWDKAAIYKVRCDFKDSIRLGPWPYYYIPIAGELSPDAQYAIIGGTIEKLYDSTYIVLDTIIRNTSPNYIGCSFSFSSFNPHKSEVLFERGCDLNEYDWHSSIGTYDYMANKHFIIDSLIGIYNCLTPAYAPDGAKIAFLANCKAYIIYREFGREEK
jgi:hypothetical protein